MDKLPNHRRPLPATYFALAAAIGSGLAIIGPVGRADAAVYPHYSVAQSTVYSSSAPKLAQDSDEDADSEVPSDQVEKYVAVYKDMQRNRSLTVETAAAREGLSVAEFRELERKIGRDDAAREHVRTELQAAAAEKP
jgi:hypothetical protein